MRASCQPMPVLMIVAPARSTAWASSTTSSQRAAAVDEVEHRQAIDDDEVAADRGARPRQDLERQAHAVLPASAPAVRAAVGARDQELVDEIALRAHHLHAVVARFLRERRAANECRDLALDAAIRELARRETGDGRLEPGRRDGERMIGIATGVQDLHADAPAGRADGVGDEPMPGEMPAAAQRAGEGLGPACGVRRDAAGDHEPDAAAGAFREIFRELRIVVGAILEAGVHRAHQHPVRQRREPEIERRQEMRKRVRRHARNHIACQPPCLPCSKSAIS